MRELLWVLAAAGVVLGQDFSGCDLYQEVAVGASYVINTPLYPSYFRGAYACRWNAVTDAAAKIVLSCDPFSPPAPIGPESQKAGQNTGQCDTVRLSVSTSGDASLSDAHLYCGEGSFSQTSDANRLVFALQTSAANTGSRFSCNVTAVKNERPPPDCVCGVRNQKRIVNGKETGVNEYPLMAGLVDLDVELVVCGASIISERHAVTAAHCLIHYTAQELALLVGDHDISTGPDTDKAALYFLKKVLPHPEYSDSPKHLNDIGVVRVVDQMSFNFAVGPVCLPFLYTYTDFLGLTVQALGWGTTSFGGPRSDVLLEANLTVIDSSVCDSDPDTAVYRVCTWGNGSDACQGDSGGPLLWQDPYSLRLQLVGIISFCTSCAVEPATNVRVTAYLYWIVQVTQDEFCVA